MNAIVKVAVIAGILLLPVSVGATLTVNPGLTVHNKCASDIIIAVHYMDTRGTWRTTSFIYIPSGAEKNSVVSSRNTVFYYYAETTSGKQARWSGDQNLEVDGKIYPMKKTILSLDRERNRFYLDLQCTKR
jgi:uncharacterized membrane protein